MRNHTPTVALGHAFTYIAPSVADGSRDAWGVQVVFDDETGSARLAIEVPARLPLEVRRELEAWQDRVVVQDARSHDEETEQSEPADEWAYASPFVRSVLQLRDDARDALNDAVFRYARGEI